MVAALELCVLICLALTPSWAQQVARAPAEVNGAVFDAEGKPVADAWVEVRQVKRGVLDAADFEGAPLKSVRSRANGGWNFHDLGEGTWIVTAVASQEPRTDAEFQELARPRSEGGPPAGVAVTRVIRHVQPGQRSETEGIDIRLATGSAEDVPLRGRVGGAFDPDRFAYELRLRRPIMAKPGETVITVFRAAGTPDPIHSAVPDAEGRFDFGAVPASDMDLIQVQRLALNATDALLGGKVLTRQLATCGDWKNGVELTLNDKQLITLHAAGGEDGAKGKAQFTIWDEHGSEANHYGRESPREATVLLEAGTYLVRAMAGEWASPLTPLRVDLSEEPAPLTLTLQRCPPFTVQLVDPQGEPLGFHRTTLGVELPGFPDPCRARVSLRNGELDMRGLLPGTYDVQFIYDVQPPFVRRLELRPDSGKIVVTAPD